MLYEQMSAAVPGPTPAGVGHGEPPGKPFTPHVLAGALSFNAVAQGMYPRIR